MKLNRVVIYVAVCICLPIVAQAASAKPALTKAVERAVTQAQLKQKTPHYYVPLVQLSEEASTPGADGEEAGIMWVEIGGQSTADGYEPEFFYLTSNQVVVETNDGPKGPFYEKIDPATFNEAYRRYAANPKSQKATVSQIRQLLTKYYRQVQAEKKQKGNPVKWTSPSWSPGYCGGFNKPVSNRISPC